MRTYAHSFFTWALAKHGAKAGRAAGIAGGVGAALPDLPAFAGTAYYVGPQFLKDGWGSMASGDVLDDIYFHGPFGSTGSVLHSAVPPTALLLLHHVLKRGRPDTRKAVQWFLVGWIGHTVADLLTHGDDTRPLLWPISNWRWSSPISYWDPRHYGLQFAAAEHGGMLLTALWLLQRRRTQAPESP